MSPPAPVIAEMRCLPNGCSSIETIQTKEKGEPAQTESNNSRAEQGREQGTETDRGRETETERETTTTERQTCPVND